MKFKQYLTLDFLLEGIKVIKNDTSIRKVSSNQYIFSVKNNDYIFIADTVSFDDQITYNVYFTNSGKITRQNKYENPGDVIKVLNKVITCLVYFINDVNPEKFTFSTNDPDLSKLYSVIILKVFKHHIFWQYIIKSVKGSFVFQRRNSNESLLTSEMINITETINEI